MTTNIAFTVDLISDLDLSTHDIFDWTGKASSLFCIVAGNISSDMAVVKRVLEHLGDCYRGIFYIDGDLEHRTSDDYDNRILELKAICNSIEPVIYLHNHVVILNNVAFVACNGWYGDVGEVVTVGDWATVEGHRLDDLSYLSNSIKRLQSYQEVFNIVLISHSIPTEYLSYNSTKVKFPEKLGPGLALVSDTAQKSHTGCLGQM